MQIKLYKPYILLIMIGGLLTLNACAQSYYYEYGKKITLTKVTPKNHAQQHIPYYQTPSGEYVGVPQEIILQCNEHISCKEALQHYPIKDLKQLSETLWLIKVADTEDIFKLSQKLYLDKNIKFAHPNFIRSNKKR
jgi:hypothetical protein